MDDREARQVWARQTGDALEIDELKEEVERLESFGLTLYDSAGLVVLQMPLLGRDCSWTMGSPGPLEVARVEVRSLTS